jgi:hypothetical protein
MRPRLSSIRASLLRSLFLCTLSVILTGKPQLCSSVHSEFRVALETRGPKFHRSDARRKVKNGS